MNVKPKSKHRQSSTDRASAPTGREQKPAPRATVSLTQLRDGERARMHAAGLCCEDCELLNALGLTDQCELRVCQVGEPCIVQVHATRLGIAATLARRIMVERV